MCIFTLLKNNHMSNRITTDDTLNFNTVEKLHAFLTVLINQGKKDFEIKVDNNDYSYENIEEIKIDDNSKKIVIA